jgi:hypothetical protein
MAGRAGSLPEPDKAETPHSVISIDCPHRFFHLASLGFNPRCGLGLEKTVPMVGLEEFNNS